MTAIVYRFPSLVIDDQAEGLGVWRPYFKVLDPRKGDSQAHGWTAPSGRVVRGGTSPSPSGWAGGTGPSARKTGLISWLT